MIKKDIVAVIGIIGITLLPSAVAVVGILVVNLGIEHIVDHRCMADRTQDIVLGIGMLVFVAGEALLGTSALLDGD